MVRSLVALIGFTAAAIGFWAAAPGWNLPYLIMWWHGLLIAVGLVSSIVATLWRGLPPPQPWDRVPLLMWLAILGGMGVAVLAVAVLSAVTLFSTRFDLTGVEGVPLVLFVAALASIPVGLVVGALAGWGFLISCLLRRTIVGYAVTGLAAALGGAIAGNRFVPLLLPIDPWVATAGSSAIAALGVIVIVTVMRNAKEPVSPFGGHPVTGA